MYIIYLIFITNGKEDKVKAVEAEIKRKNIKTTSTSYSSLIEEFVNKANIDKGIGIYTFMNYIYFYFHK